MIPITRRGIMASGFVGTAGAVLPSAASPLAPAAPLAPRPPMGWNSWNSFATTITEAQARETAAIMARELLPFGYDVFTVDIQWYEPEASSYDYNRDPTPAMDGYGRLIPAPNRFPSSTRDRGFAPLAADVHGLGMKFGIHLMRGIPRLAVKRNLPILGTRYHAADIADTASICSWNPDMYGVDMTKPGAQAYYDSVFRLYAGWGVDFIKMDDMGRPYDAHAPEIEAAHTAIANSSRPMILSLSPGETPVVRGHHARAHAQMWRISDDFWDEWPMLEAQFVRLENWNTFMGAGGWPDADMLPLDRLALGKRDTKFTPDEQRTLMTLWSIARSPLIMGGDLRHLDRATLALLTHRHVLAVNQASADNQPHFVEDGARVWSARAERGRDRYLALFNTSGTEKDVGIALSQLGISRAVTVDDLWTGKTDGIAEKHVTRRLRPHASALLRLR